MRLTWGFIVLGSLAVLFTSVCYALSPEALALPVPPARLAEAALAAAGDGTRLLRLGGTIGVLGDVLFAAAALALAVNARGHAALGWALGGVSATLFTVVDAMAARSLGAGPTFVYAKALFDVLFTVGTFSFAVATLLVFWSERARLLAKAALAVGGIGVLASVAVLFGADAGPALGLVIAAGVAIYGVEGVVQLGLPALPRATPLPA